MTIDWVDQCPEFPGYFERYFGNRIGYFVEVGAYDGEKYSFTKQLPSLGWGGLCIEPNPESFILLKNRYEKFPKITCAQIAIGTQRSYDLSLDGALSTTRRDIRKVHENSSWLVEFPEERLIRIPGITLNDMLFLAAAPPAFEILVIDTEGAELDVLRSFSIMQWLPQMVIVETNETHPILELRQDAKEINAYFDRAGYYRMHSDALNNIYISPPLQGM